MCSQATLTWQENASDRVELWRGATLHSGRREGVSVDVSQGHPNEDKPMLFIQNL